MNAVTGWRQLRVQTLNVVRLRQLFRTGWPGDRYRSALQKNDQGLWSRPDSGGQNGLCTNSHGVPRSNCSMPHKSRQSGRTESAEFPGATDASIETRTL